MAQFFENSLDGLHKLKHTVAMYLSNFVSNYLTYPLRKPVCPRQCLLMTDNKRFI